MSGRHRRSPTPRRGRHRRPPSRQRLIVPALAATVVLGGSGTALGLAVGGTTAGTTTPQITPFSAPVVLSTAPVVDPTPSVTSTPTPRPTTVHTGRSLPGRSRHTHSRYVVKLTVTGSESYIQVKTWNYHLLERTILHHGQRLTYHQRGLRLVLGNAGAVRIAVAGRPGHVAGRPGQVRRFRLS